MSYPETTTLENFLIDLNAPTDFSSYTNKDNIESVKTRFYTTQNGVFSINTVNFNYFGLDNTKTLADAIAKLSEPLPISTLYLGNKVKVGQNGKLDAGSTQIVNVASPVNAQDAATMGYVNANVDVQKLRIDDITAVCNITQTGAAFTGNLTGNVTGNLTGTSTLVNITSDNSNTTCYIPFATGVGSKNLFIDNITSPLSYNPNTGLLITKGIWCNSLISEVATNLDIGTRTTTNRINFNNTSTTGNICFMDVNGLTMNGKTIYTGNISSLSSYDIRIATANTGNSILFNNTGSTGNICYMDVNGLTMAAGKTITGNVTGNLTGDVTGNASSATNVNVTISADTNALFYPTFVSGSASGNKALLIDSAAGFELFYNPQSNTLNSRNITSLSLTSITGSDVRIATASTANSIVFNNTGTSGNICNMNSAGLNMAAGKTISAASSAGAELAFNVPNSTGNLTFTGTNIQSDTSGPFMGKYLRIKLNGVFYKIQLSNDT